MINLEITYPPWLQHWRVRCPTLSGRLSTSPLFTPFTGMATSVTVNQNQDREIFIGLTTGEVTKFVINARKQLIQVSTKPPNQKNVDCGSVKQLSMHGNNLLIAWERCLVEQEGKFFYHSKPYDRKSIDNSAK